MSKSKIYTFTGDAGETGLVSGSRVAKSDDRIDLYGELDELNSRLGYVVALMRTAKDLSREINFLENIQSSLFDLGSNLAIEASKRAEWKLPRISKETVSSVEAEIDWIDAGLDPLKNFILPGGTVLAASIHLCRTCTRAVERRMVAYSNSTGEELPENSLKLINRLSDYFFVLARNMNKQSGHNEPIWRPSN